MSKRFFIYECDCECCTNNVDDCRTCPRVSKRYLTEEELKEILKGKTE